MVLFDLKFTDLGSDCHEGHGDGTEQVYGVGDGEAGQEAVEGVGHLRSNQDRD